MLYELKEEYFENILKRKSSDFGDQFLFNPRYYAKTLYLNDINLTLLIPLHSSCKGDFYFLNSVPFSNHYSSRSGLDFNKIVIMNDQEFRKYSSVVLKFERIKKEIEAVSLDIEYKLSKYLMNTIPIVSKKLKGHIISKEEKNIIKFATLNHYPEEVLKVQEFLKNKNDRKVKLNENETFK